MEAARTHRAGSGLTRLMRAWRALPHESRLAAFASLGLFLTLFLPWYQRHFFVVVAGHAQPAADSQTGWGAFSFVEAAILVVAAGVLVLLFERAEGRAFHLPGGDGGVITAAGLWACLLVVWRIFDKQGATSHGTFVASYGIEWGIFFTLAAAAFLAYSGSRIRAAHRPEPPLPGEDRAPAGSSAAATVVRPPRAREARGRNSRDREAPAREAQGREAAAHEAAAHERPRRRARPPIPVPADPAELPTRTDFPTRADAPLWADPAPPSNGPPSKGPPSKGPPSETPPSEAPPDAPPDRPRRRPSASELFERVTPEDPPAMPFGRAKRSDIDLSGRHPEGPDAPPPTDDQLTIPFADRGSEDETLPLAADHRSRSSEDETVRLGEDATVQLGEEATQPLGTDDTLPLDR